MNLFKKYYSLLVVFISIYLLLTFLIPPDPAGLAKYNITELQSRLLSMSFVLPIVGIWFAAFYGFVNFKKYALSIKSSSDGKALERLVNGIGVMAVTMPLQSLISSSLNFIGRNNREFIPMFTIATNYISVAIVVTGFTLIMLGSKDLSKTVKTKTGLVSRFIEVGFLLVFGGLYAYLSLINPVRTIPNPHTGRATYFLPDLLIFATIIVPYLYVWFSGFEAVINISAYQKNVAGIVYKKALKFLTLGIGSVIFSSVFLQFFVALSAGLADWGLAQLLSLIYVLLVVIAIGYVFIALGAKKLNRIEEL